MENLLNKLSELGYKTKLIDFGTYYDIVIEANSFYTFKDSDKDIISKMFGNDLMEFYYCGNQHIYIRKNIVKERLKKIKK